MLTPLYHIGFPVLLKGQIITKVMLVVSRGDKLRCPHCNKKIQLAWTTHSLYGYYLDIPNSENCCKPFSADILKFYPKRANCSFSYLLNDLKKR